MIDLLPLLNTRCTVKKPASGVSTSGVPKTPKYVAQYSVPCAIAPMRGDQFTLYGKYVSRAGSIAYLPTLVTIDAKDLIVCNGRTYEVQFVDRRRDEAGDESIVFAVVEETV